MSDVPAKESGSDYLRVAPEPASPPKDELDFAAPRVAAPKTAVSAADMTITHGPGSGPRPTFLLFGLAVLLLGVVLATLPMRTWVNIVTLLTTGTLVTTTEETGTKAAEELAAAIEKLPTFVQHLTTETSRWIVSGLLVVAALSVLRARAFAVIVTGVLFALTIFCCDALLAGRLSRFVSGWFGEGSPLYALPLIAATFGYLVHALPVNSKISVRGAIGLLLVAVASFGTIHNWYDWTPLATRIGPTASELLSEWTEECTWATVLILTAIGVASSRTRPVHLLIAIMLLALAYHCVSSGLSQMRSFPELAVQEYVPTVEDINYRNVEIWRWVVAVELAILAAVLLHLSLGIGALNLAFALTWMIAGMGVYGALSNMSLMRTVSDSMSRSAASPGTTPSLDATEPLSNWGLPIGPPPQQTQATGQTPARPPTTPGETQTTPTLPTATPTSQDLDEARLRALASIARPTTIREITPLVWMFLTAALAGLIAVTGVSMMTSSRTLRRLAFCALWVGLGISGTILWSVWPKGAETWLGWLAAWRYSQHHTSAIWLTFLGSAAICGYWALRHDANLATWVHASAAAILLGTCLTIGAVAILIHWGGFPALPTWVYIALAAGQSSLMWALLMHQSIAERRAQQLA